MYDGQNATHRKGHALYDVSKSKKDTSYRGCHPYKEVEVEVFLCHFFDNFYFVFNCHLIVI